MKKIVACDTETTGLNPYGTFKERGHHPDRPFAFSFTHYDGNTFYVRFPVDKFTRRVDYSASPDDFRMLREFFSDPSITKVFHGASFDLAMLDFAGLSCAGPFYDTRILAHVADSSRRTFALKPLTKALFDFPDDDQKDLKDSVKKARREGKKLGWKLAEDVEADYAFGDPALCEKYAVGDTNRTIRLYKFYEPLLTGSFPPDSPYANYRELVAMEHALVPIAMGMTREGATLDMAKVTELEAYYTSCMEKADQAQAEAGYAGLNPKSPKQVAEVMYGQLGATKQYKSRKDKLTGGRSKTLTVDKKALAGLSETIPLAQALLERSEAEKQLTGFLRPFRAMAYMEAGNHTLHPGYNTVGPVTGRMSCVAKGTPIEVCRDVSKLPAGVAIENVRVGDYAYCFDNNLALRLSRVKSVWSNGKKKVLKVFWKGQGGHRTGSVKLTPEHRVRLLDGTYAEAGNLLPGDRVMAMSRGNSCGYARLWATGHEEISREHRFIFKEVYGTISEHVHHKDGNKLNNEPSNLEGVSSAEHCREHSANPSAQVCLSRVRNGKTPERLARLKEMCKVAHEKTRLKFSKEFALEVLWENGGKPTAFRDVCGFDYASAMKRLRALGVSWKDTKKEIRLAQNNHIIEAVINEEEELEVFDIEMEDHANFIASEICVHNCKDPNLQNITSPDSAGKLTNIEFRVRECFSPPKGTIWLLSDYGQIEIYCTAYLSGDRVMIDALESGKKLHDITCVNVLKGVPGSPDWEAKRKKAKITNFLLQYRGGAGQLAQTLGIPYEEALAITKQYWETYSGLDDFYKRLEREYKRNGFVKSLFGRPFRVPFEKESYKLGNYISQGAAAEIIKKAMIEVHRRLPRHKTKLIMQVHDELVFKAPSHLLEYDFRYDLKALVTDIEEAMQGNFGELLGMPTDLPVETSVTSTNWAGKEKVSKYLV